MEEPCCLMQNGCLQIDACNKYPVEPAEQRPNGRMRLFASSSRLLAPRAPFQYAIRGNNKQFDTPHFGARWAAGMPTMNRRRTVVRTENVHLNGARSICATAHRVPLCLCNLKVSLPTVCKASIFRGNRHQGLPYTGGLAASVGNLKTSTQYSARARGEGDLCHRF